MLLAWHAAPATTNTSRLPQRRARVIVLTTARGGEGIVVTGTPRQGASRTGTRYPRHPACEHSCTPDATRARRSGPGAWMQVGGSVRGLGDASQVAQQRLFAGEVDDDVLGVLAD